MVAAFPWPGAIEWFRGGFGSWRRRGELIWPTLAESLLLCDRPCRDDLLRLPTLPRLAVRLAGGDGGLERGCASGNDFPLGWSACQGRPVLPIGLSLLATGDWLVGITHLRSNLDRWPRLAWPPVLGASARSDCCGEFRCSRAPLACWLPLPGCFGSASQTSTAAFFMGDVGLSYFLGFAMAAIACGARKGLTRRCCSCDSFAACDCRGDMGRVSEGTRLYPRRRSYHRLACGPLQPSRPLCIYALQWLGPAMVVPMLWDALFSGWRSHGGADGAWALRRNAWWRAFPNVNVRVMPMADQCSLSLRTSSAPIKQCPRKEAFAADFSASDRAVSAHSQRQPARWLAEDWRPGYPRTRPWCGGTRERLIRLWRVRQRCSLLVLYRRPCPPRRLTPRGWPRFGARCRSGPRSGLTQRQLGARRRWRPSNRKQGAVARRRPSVCPITTVRRRE